MARMVRRVASDLLGRPAAFLRRESAGTGVLARVSQGAFEPSHNYSTQATENVAEPKAQPSLSSPGPRQHPGIPEGMVSKQSTAKYHRKVTNLLVNVHKGLDYMDYAYPLYVSDPNFHTQVTVDENDNPVTFAYCYVSDEGDTSSYGGGRTRVDMHSMGLNTANGGMFRGRLQSAGITTTEGHKVLWVPFLDSRHMARIERDKEGKYYELRATRHFICYDFKLGVLQKMVQSPDFKALRRQYSVDKVGRPSVPQLEDLFQCEDKLKQFFPSTCLLTSWVPYPARLSSVKHLNNHSVIHMAGDTWGRDCDSISFTASVLCHRGVRYDIDVYGGGPDQVIAHVLKAIEWVAGGTNFSNPDLCISMVYYNLCEETVKVPLLREFLESWDCEGGPWNQNPYNVSLLQFDKSFKPWVPEPES